jgi:hypothetical protein
MANVVISGTTSICEIVQRESLCLRGVTKMAENKMEAVAALFGKKLNEPFTIKCERYVFSEKGFGHGNEHGVACHVPDVLERLLAGKVKIDE